MKLFSVVNLGFCWYLSLEFVFSSLSLCPCARFSFPCQPMECDGLGIQHARKFVCCMKIEVWITLLTFLSFHRFVTDFIFTMPFNARDLILFAVVPHAIVTVPCIALILVSRFKVAHRQDSSCQRAFARTKRSCCCHLIQSNLAAYTFFVRAAVRSLRIALRAFYSNMYISSM